MQITCIDQSEGRLFFANEILAELNNSEHKIYLYLPENYRDIYGNFFKHFHHIRIKVGLQKLNSIAPNIIFSNADYLNNLQQIGDNLIYPILKDSEIEVYSKWFNQLDEEVKSNIVPVESDQSNKSIAQPESKWAKDMLERRISNQPLKGKSFLISAGPTVEDIDPVRFLTNRSSGKMGIALARAAYINGADVQLIIGPTGTNVPAYLRIERIRSAKDMYTAVMGYFEYCDVYIGSAAIADFTPADVKNDKIKKKEGFSQLILQPTKDILKEISTIKKNQILIGFSVETMDPIENSKAKMINKNLDLVVVNNPKEKGAAFDAETNVVSVIHKDGRIQSWPIMSKLDVAKKLILEIKNLL